MIDRNKFPSIKRVMDTSQGLKREMKTRDAIMVAVGGTLGTGIFLSSGDVLAKAGPGGAIVAYLLGGFIIWLMTACLGELASAMPVAGSMQAYCTEFINPAMGITIGWVNWIGGAITITTQIVASAIIMKNIFPNVSTYVWILAFSALLFAVNFFRVSAFGDISFYFSSIKVVALGVFVIIGLGMIFFGLGHGGQAIGFKNYTAHGGFFPLGIGAVGSVILSSFYAFGGTEMVAVSGGELKKEEDMPKVINWTLILLVGAYIVLVLILSALLPWNQADLQGSPFAYVFRNVGMPSAELIVNIIVLTSALTSGNYFVYACTRYLWSLAKFDQAPKVLSKVNKKGIPVLALCVSMAFALIGIVSEFVAEDTVYRFLIYFIGGVNIFVYTLICICQWNFRKRFRKEGGKDQDLNYKVPYPITPILGILAFLSMLVVSLMDPEERVSFLVCVPLYIVIYIGSYIYTKKHKDARSLNIDL